MNCPNCGKEDPGSFAVCNFCGKVYCPWCDQKGKNPYGGDACPRCGQTSAIFYTDFFQIAKALRNSQN